MRYFLLTVISSFTFFLTNGQVAVSTDGSTPHASAMLEVKTTNRGFLLPRLTDAQKNAISSPATGLMIYETTSNAIWVYNSSAWVQMGSGGGGGTSPWTISGNNIFNSNTGNVGIGTASPNSKLQVNGNVLVNEANITISDPFGGLYLRNGSTNRAYVQLRGADFDMHLGTLPLNTTGNLFLQTQGVNRMTIVPNGNVGIGTTSPSTTLDVNGGIRATANILLDDGMLRFLNTTDSKLWDLSYSSSTNLFTIKETGANRLVIANGGNVGIGIVPTEKLHVSGSALFNGEATFNTTNPTLQLQNSGVNKGFVQLSDDNIRIGTNSGNTAGKFVIRTNGGDRFFVDASGNVSIGTTDVANGYRVSIAGKVICEEVRVQLRTAWPDYVFANNYRLMNLKELERFILTNRHLPNIPAATQVEKEGIALGDMQKKMMEKIEELTLYIIQQQKEIDALKASLQSTKTIR